MSNTIIHSHYKHTIDLVENRFKAYYMEMLNNGSQTSYYNHQEDYKENKAVEKFDIFRLKKINSMPNFYLPKDNLLHIENLLSGMDIHIVIPEDSKILYLKEKYCYLVERNRKTHMIVFANPSCNTICVINMIESTGEVLYPKDHYSVKFWFRNRNSKFIENDYMITEYMINNDLSSKVENSFIEEDTIGKIECLNYKYNIPVCFTYDGLYVPPAGTLISVLEEYRTTKDCLHYEYEKQIIL